jgi:hypothetical protein
MKPPFSRSLSLATWTALDAQAATVLSEWCYTKAAKASKTAQATEAAEAAGAAEAASATTERVSPAEKSKRKRQ